MGNYEWTVQHKGEFSGWSDESTAAAFTAVAPPDCLYSGSGDSTVRKLDPNDLAEASQFGGHSGNVGALAWGADGYLYSGSKDDTVRKLDPNDMTEVAQFTGNTRLFGSLVWGADGYLYSGSGVDYWRSEDNTVRKINPNDMTEMAQFTSHSEYVAALAWSWPRGTEAGIEYPYPA